MLFFCMFYQVNITGHWGWVISIGLAQQSLSSFFEIGLEVTFGTTLHNRKPQMPSSCKLCVYIFAQLFIYVHAQCGI